ncbi:tocopherol o-methyltransferase [Quercus suber]|uniref:Tocopherol o-methyltransferase n=1 Tax=Quercus suber TaxID=58331 RepID=A0AAW0JCW5_QUESU
MRENLTMMRKVKRDRLDGERFDPNGACVDMEQCNLQLICGIKGLKCGRDTCEVAEDIVLKKGITEFYDELSGVWEDIWGDHMHHGFYDPHSTVDVSGHRVTQIRMINEALQFAGVSGRFLSLIHLLTLMQLASS